MRHAPLFLVCLLLVACGSETPVATPPETDAAKTVVPASGENEAAAKTDADSGKPPEGAPAVLATWRGEGTSIKFNAWKMGCSGCSATIQKRLGEIDGVEAVDARVDQALVQVDIKDAAKREAIITEITKALEQPESGRKFEILRAK